MLPPEESIRKMVLPDGYVAELVASEPAIAQPIDLRFDERGRLWVVQYKQYPFPAGVTITSYDQYLRGEMVDEVFSDARLAEAMATVPEVSYP